MLLVLLLAAAGLLLAPQAAASGALQGLRACGTRVIPALLPFFVVSRMLTALPLPTPGRRADRLFHALFGVRAACLPALLTGLLLPGSARPAALRTARREKPVLSSLLPEAVQGSCTALLQVSGLIVFFSSMLAVLRAAGLTALLPNRLAEALACGALELSSGILLLSGPGAEAACALLMGWGGLCVHFQAMSLWQTAGLCPHGYFSAKLLHGLLSAVLALACFAPSPAALLSAGVLTACALLAPLLRKIRAGNLRHAAV